MKNVSKLLFVVLAIMLVQSGCRTKRVRNAGYTSGRYEVECMGTGLDGTQLLKVWGYGTNPKTAIHQAEKNAVHAVIFKGVNAGKPGCMTRPLVTQPNADQIHSEYFNKFFKDGGRYLHFISMSNDGSMERIKTSQNEYKVGAIISVRHSVLREELENEGIIKKLGQGF